MKKKEMIWLYISIISFFLMSASFLVMPFDYKTTGIEAMDFLGGIMFWMFLILGIASQIILAQKRKNWFIKNHVRRFKGKSKIGIVAFFQNLPAIIADCMVILSVLGLTISAIVTDGTGYVCYIFVSSLVFSFSMHCIFNGKIYNFLANIDKDLNVSQQKHLNVEEKE